MLGSALVLEHLAKTAKSDTGSLADNSLRVLETSLDEGPEIVHVRANVLGAALYRDTESHHGSLAVVGVLVGHVGLHLLEQRREDVAGRELSSETVNDTERQSRGRVLVNVLRVLLDSDGHETDDHVLGETKALHLGALVRADPDERVEAHETEVLLVLLVGTVGKEEVDKLGDVVGNDGNFEHADLFENVKDLADTVLVALLKALVEDTDHLGDSRLHGSKVGGSIALEVLSNLTESSYGGDADLDGFGVLQALGEKLHDLWKMLVKCLTAINKGLEDSVEDEERDLTVCGIGRVSSVEEERKKLGPCAERELSLGNLGDDTGNRVADRCGLLVKDDFEKLALDSVANLYVLLVPDLSSALCETLPQLNGSELTDSKVWRGCEDLEKCGNTLCVLVVVVLQLLGSGLDGVGVGNVALLQELVQALNEVGYGGKEGRFTGRVGQRTASWKVMTFRCGAILTSMTVCEMTDKLESS